MEKQIETEVTIKSAEQLDRAIALEMSVEDDPSFIISEKGGDVNGESGNNNDGGEKDGVEIHVPEL